MSEWSSSSTSTVFSPLMLEYGECYLEDCSAVLYCNDGLTNSYKGWLRLCSNSIVFDTQNNAIPVIRINHKHIIAIHTLATDNAIHNPHAAQLALPHLQHTQRHNAIINNMHIQEALLIQINQYTHLYKHKPADHIELYNTTANNIINRPNIVFAFPFAKATKIFELLHNLHQINSSIAQGGKFRSAGLAKLKHLIGKCQQGTSFNASWLVNFREKALLKNPILAYQVSPLLKSPGWLQITESRIYFQPLNNYSLEPVSLFEIKTIRGIYVRRYTLRNVGLEIYFKKEESMRQSGGLIAQSDKPSLFLSFDTQALRDEVVHSLQQICGENIVLNSLSRVKAVQTQWVRGLMSNFDYLMFLNEQAGRSFNDLTQYPVFPWVIADYTSKELDFSNQQTFRDLSKPVGALNQKRLKALRDRMEDLGASDPKMKFLYGTHYSTPAYVLFFLVRLYPEYMLCLQNGKFDEADRLFNSMSETWNSCLNNPADVKEVIPQFYGFCERKFKSGDFLKNVLELDLGLRQNGKYVEDVELPPWASSSEKFVSICREALESDYVSKNLHQWIDLIFGYKNSGDEALKADNLFYYLTYEGAVDIDAIQDLEEKQSIEAQINEFGQTPKQLFSTPHPPRNVTNIILEEKSKLSFDSASSLTPVSSQKDYLSRNFRLDFPPFEDLQSQFNALEPSFQSPLSVAFSELESLKKNYRQWRNTSSEFSRKLEQDHQRELENMSSELQQIIDYTENCKRSIQKLTDEESASKIMVELGAQNLESLKTDFLKTESLHQKMTKIYTERTNLVSDYDCIPLFPMRNYNFIPGKPSLFTKICGFLKLPEIAALENVCKTWRKVIHESKAWHLHLKKRGRLYEVEDDSRWFHEHYLFELKIDDEKSCLISVEEVSIPNSIPECRNMTLKERMQNDPRLRHELQNARTGLIELCRRTPGKLDLEVQFCVKALKLHRRFKRFENNISKFESSLKVILADKEVFQRELVEHEPILEELKKELSEIKVQFASDEATKMFLTSQRDTSSKIIQNCSSELQLLAKSNQKFLEEKENQLTELTNRSQAIFQSLDSSRFELKKQVVLLASEWKNLQAEAEVLEKDEVSILDGMNGLKTILQISGVY